MLAERVPIVEKICWKYWALSAWSRMTPASRFSRTPAVDQHCLLTSTLAPSTTMPLLWTLAWILTRLTMSNSRLSAPNAPWQLASCTRLAHTVRKATVGGIRDARMAGIRPANAPIRMPAAMPPNHASAGMTTAEPFELAYTAVAVAPASTPTGRTSSQDPNRFFALKATSGRGRVFAQIEIAASADSWSSWPWISVTYPSVTM